MKKIIVSVDPYEARAALLDNGRLVNIEIESATATKRKGNIYKGVVTSLEASLGAAFVDYGGGKDGFLPYDEISNAMLMTISPYGKKRSLARGDYIMVQVVKEEHNGKGAALTTHISLPGRYVVLMPFSGKRGISRKVCGEERARLKQLASQLDVPKGYGVIVRTVGEKELLSDLQADLDVLHDRWKEILQKFKMQKGPGLIYSDASLAVRFVRDYMTLDVVEVLVEDEHSYQELARFFDMVMPQKRGILKRYNDPMPLFSKFGVEQQMDALLNDRVPLPSGGSIVIGQTEALVAIDVNAGRSKQRDTENTAFRVNLEAAREIARQLILRDLGGIVVVDFIDMKLDQHRHQVEDELKKALAMDKARLTFGEIGEFGLMIFSRQRLRQSVEASVTEPCPLCSGSGRIRSPTMLAMATLRKVRERLATHRSKVEYVEVRVPLNVANFLNNRKRDALLELERRFDVVIDVLGDTDASPNDIKVSLRNEVPKDRNVLQQEELIPQPEPKTEGVFKSLIKRWLKLSKDDEPDEGGAFANNSPDDISDSTALETTPTNKRRRRHKRKEHRSEARQAEASTGEHTDVRPSKWLQKHEVGTQNQEEKC